MAKYMKRPVVVEAVEVREALRCARGDWSAMSPWVKAAYVDGKILFLHNPPRVQIATLEGSMTGHVDDWIIQGIKGEIYPCKPDIFESTYERVMRPGEIGDEDGE
jgi:hypothetical protein